MKYFGTDGIRGVVGEKINARLAYLCGLAAATMFGRGEYIVGRDTRVSGEELVHSVCQGIRDGGGDTVDVGVVPTPAVAFWARRIGAVAAIMVTASHNLGEFNGIKIFDGRGLKLNEEQEGSIEYYIDNPTKPERGGHGRTVEQAFLGYADYLVANLPRLEGLEAVLDCGYGAMGLVAGRVFEGLGARVCVENCSGRGEKINAGCGALYADYVARSASLCQMRMGFAFDGDGDRMSAVLDGTVIDGDSVLYTLSRCMELRENVVIGTVLSNMALEKRLAEDGKRLVRTPVGDKHICDLLFRQGYTLGGEQSGHYIVAPHSTTGDGLIAAVLLGWAVLNGKMERLALVPQRSVSVVADGQVMYDRDLLEVIEQSTQLLGSRGRLIVRMSGTEPKLRIMCECEDADIVDQILGRIAKVVQRDDG